MGKNERFNLRLSADAKQQIERAASFEGTTASAFILSSALSQAEQTIREHESMRLSRRDAEALLDALTDPPKPNQDLIRALEEHERRVVRR